MYFSWYQGPCYNEVRVNVEMGIKGIQEYLQSKINFTEPGWNHE